jgi:multiple sugar transport system substrate-binding protein
MQEFLPRQWSFYGKSVLDNGDVVIDSIQNVKTLQNLKESFACSPPESLGFFWDDQIRQFFQGKVAMINTFNSHIHRTTDASWNEVVNQIGYDDIPGNIPMLGGWVLGINRRSKSAEQAFQYIKWACSDQLAIHNTLLGGLVPKTCVIQNKELMLTYPWFEKMQNAPDKGRIGDLIRKRNGSLVDCFDLDKTMGESIIDVLLDRRNIPDTLKIIGQNIQKLL